FQRVDVGQLAADHRRQQVALEDLPGGFDGLVGVPGTLTRDALTPVRTAVDLEADEQRIAVLLHAEAGTKRLEQPHFEYAQLDTINLHDPSIFMRPVPSSTHPGAGN